MKVGMKVHFFVTPTDTEERAKSWVFLITLLGDSNIFKSILLVLQKILLSSTVDAPSRFILNIFDTMKVLWVQIQSKHFFFRHYWAMEMGMNLFHKYYLTPMTSIFCVLNLTDL
jgi:hypothetical protein